MHLTHKGSTRLANISEVLTAAEMLLLDNTTFMQFFCGSFCILFNYSNFNRAVYNQKLWKLSTERCNISRKSKYSSVIIFLETGSRFLKTSSVFSV